MNCFKKQLFLKNNINLKNAWRSSFGGGDYWIITNGIPPA